MPSTAGKKRTSDPPEGKELKVFVSYSRQDLEFVDRLQASLIEHGITPFVDREDIEKGEDWWARIQQLIIDADTIVFVTSPSSVTSDICQREVDYAEGLNKRFVPIVPRDLGSHAVPDALARLNYIFFVENRNAGASGDYDDAVELLVRALETDITWIREHTRLGALAERWESRDRPGSLVLRGAELSAGETWLTTRPKNAPNPTDAHRAFITQSRNTATKRQRAAVGLSLAGLVVALGLAGLAYWQRGVAVRNEIQANKERDTALVTQSRFLADRARHTEAGDAVTGMLLNLEALPDVQLGRLRPWVVEAEKGLFSSWLTKREAIVLKDGRSQTSSAVYDATGIRIVTVNQNGTGHVWDAETGATKMVLGASHNRISSVSFSLDGTQIIVGLSDGRLQIVDAGTNQVVKTWRAHQSAIKKISIDSSGSRFITTSKHEARTWDAVSGTLIFELNGHRGRVLSAEFSRDGSKILTTDEFGATRLWDTKTGLRVFDLNVLKSELKLGIGSATAAAISPDSKRIATGVLNQLYIWDAITGQQLFSHLEGHRDPILAISFSPNSKLIATVSRDGTGRVWDAVAGQLVTTLDGHGGPINSVQFSASGRWLATASDDKSVRVWDANSGRNLAILSGHIARISHVALNPNGRQILSVSDDGTARIWQGIDAVRILREHKGHVNSVDLSIDGSLVVTASDDGSARVWNTDTGERVSLLQGHKGEVLDATFSPDASRVATASQDNTVRVWDSMSGKQLFVLNGHTDDVMSVLFSADGLLILTASRDKTARIWNSTTGNVVSVLAGHRDLVQNATFDSANKKVVTASHDTTARIWDVGSGTLVSTLAPHWNQLWNAQFSPDGQRIVTASQDSMARLWDTASGELIAILEGHKYPVVRAVFSPDGRQIATASADSTARIWDGVTGKTIAVLSGHTKQLTWVSYSFDGTRIVTASNDGTARIWNSATGEEIGVLQGHQREVLKVRFDRNGRKIITASADRTARIWQTFSTNEELVHHMKMIAPRCLTVGQRKAAFLSPEPPRWCVTGVDYEIGNDHEKWTGKWPFHTNVWRNWLIARDRGEIVPLPAN